MIVLFNPRSTTPGKQPLPLSLMALGAVLESRHRWVLVDGNVEADAAAAVLAAFDASPDTTPILAVTVMPGPQVAHAVDVCRRIRSRRPDAVIVWGGYFPTQHTAAVIHSPLVDFAVRSQGEGPLLALIDTIMRGGALSDVPGLSWRRDGRAIDNPIGRLTPLDDLPELPYHRVPMERYLHRNYLGDRTVAHYTSFGCPFDCAFCAVGTMAHRRWLSHGPARMAATLAGLRASYGVDAVQMHDMDFFIHEGRTREFADRITPLGLTWWALGRVDVLMGYDDATWRAMRDSGLKMIFSGAESGDDAELETMRKGGTASSSLTLALARRMRAFGIVPEFSFVLGAPPDPLAGAATTFAFIRRIKQVNPSAEIVLYTWTPVVTPDGDGDFAFPDSLERFASPEWQRLSMRRGDGLPWITRRVRARARNFERVLNAYYPTVTDPRLTGVRRAVLRAAAGWRYRTGLYSASYELRALHRLMRYQRPETTGF